ncbi:MAG: DsbA family protein [Rhodospirillaceae bacterium]|nr:DsbA family protein [Rhodospirillaceae bacterium]
MLKRREFLAAVTIAAALPVVGLRAQEAQPLPDMIMGDPDAPIEIIEYSSMTCPHCAAFHTGTLPQLKAEYLDTGRAKLVFREFPLDRVALMVSAIARCSGEDRFFPFVDVMFRTQEEWARAANPTEAIKSIVRMGGQDPAMADACLEDQAVIDGILAVRLAGDQTYDINSTPTFIVNGESVPGNLTFEEFDELLREIEGNV